MQAVGSEISQLERVRSEIGIKESELLLMRAELATLRQKEVILMQGRCICSPHCAACANAANSTCPPNAALPSRASAAVQAARAAPTPGVCGVTVVVTAPCTTPPGIGEHERTVLAQGAQRWVGSYKGIPHAAQHC